MKIIARLSIAIIASTFVLSGAAFAKGSGGRVYYGGGHHTSSHGGSFPGGSGSSHKGGHYKNTRTRNQYGRHK
jgi:hypothetical protein